MHGNAAFFAPLIRTVPSSGFPPRITNLSMMRPDKNFHRRASAVGSPPVLSTKVSTQAIVMVESAGAEAGCGFDMTQVTLAKRN
jgi:hypothetical protein